MLAHFAGISLEAQLAEPDAELAPEQAKTFFEAVAQVAAGYPLPYLTGRREFYGLEFEVTPAVLIPRPETELLVEATLAALSSAPAGPLVDIGTGSGIVAVCLAREASARYVIATDLSREALEVARRNAARHGVAELIHFLQADLLAAFSARPTFAAIVSNPPYVEPGDLPKLPGHARDYEPRMALSPPIPVEDFLLRLFQEAAERLLPGGALMLEMGLGQEELYRGLAGQAGLAVEAVLPDLAGIPRALVARWI
jgi:release factor glutamine methyltransferase